MDVVTDHLMLKVGEASEIILLNPLLLYSHLVRAPVGQMQ